MMTREICSAAVASILLLAASFGCDYNNDTLTSALSEPEVANPVDDAAAMNKFFTGRDSFGVAMKIRLSGDAVVTSEGRCPNEAVILTGTGNATHLGRIEGSLSHCVDGGDLASVVNGEFTFSGSSGDVVRGSYERQPVVEKRGGNRNGGGVVIETKADITDGHVTAVKRDVLEGRGDLHIQINSAGSFVQTFDGWLLHHVAED